jgi:hypothetical protein
MWVPIATAGLAVSLQLLVVCPALVASPPLQPRQAVLLLRNGEVLQGTVTRSGDRYHVQLGDTGQVRIPVADVEMAGRDLGELYRQQLRGITPDQADRYLKLSRWCLGQGMLDESADCYLRAASADPGHPDLDRMEASIDRAARRGLRGAPSAAAPPGPLPVGDAMALDELPAGTVAVFTRTIQPILLNRCALAACHGSSSESGYCLHQRYRGRSLTRGQTLENLRATLAWIDHTAPQQSRLLVAAESSHGCMDGVAPLDRHAYRRLVDWVTLVSRPATAPGADATPAAAQITPETPEDQTPDRLPSALTDPFDPEVFNRQHARQKGSAASTPPEPPHSRKTSGEQVDCP